MAFLRSVTFAGRRWLSSNPMKCQMLRYSSPICSMTQARCVTIKASPAPPPSTLTFEEKNEGVRPLSPHLLIYKMQLTSVMSISHRITGMILAGYATILAFSSFTSLDLASLAETIQLPYAISFIVKYILAFPAFYHLFNGIRHLIWDAGKLFAIKQVYLGGYVVLALTVLFSIIMSK